MIEEGCPYTLRVHRRRKCSHIETLIAKSKPNLSVTIPYLQTTREQQHTDRHHPSHPKHHNLSSGKSQSMHKIIAKPRIMSISGQSTQRTLLQPQLKITRKQNNEKMRPQKSLSVEIEDILEARLRSNMAETQRAKKTPKSTTTRHKVKVSISTKNWRKY